MARSTAVVTSPSKRALQGYLSQTIVATSLSRRFLQACRNVSSQHSSQGPRHKVMCVSINWSLFLFIQCYIYIYIYSVTFSTWLPSKKAIPFTLYQWGCALSWFLWWSLGCCNSHVDGLGLEKYKIVPWAPWIYVAFIHDVHAKKGHGSPETFLKGILSRPHRDSPWWIIMIRSDEPSWRIMMNRYD